MVAVATGLALSGCNITTPDIALPIPTGFQAGASGPSRPVSSEWVNLFGSRELDSLVTVALGQNLDIESAIARFRQAEAQTVVAGAALYPTIDGSGSATRDQGSVGGGGGGGFGNGSVSTNRFSLGLNASYEVDLFGRTQYAVRAADQTARASRFDRDTLALSTMASVANTYFAVLSSQDRLRLAQDNIRTAGRVLEAVRGRLSVGTGTALDTAQQESVLASQRARIPPLVQDVGQNRNALAVLLGRAPESATVRGGSLLGLRLPAPRAGLPSELLLRRPDIASAEATLASAEASVASARAAFFPNIQLTGSAGQQSAALRSLFGPNAFVYSLAAGLTQPLFDGFLLKGQFDLQEGRTAEFAAAYKKAIIQGFSDVENALIAVRQSAELEARQSEAVAASQRALDLSETRLKEGTIDIVTLFTVQTTLFSAQDTLAVARFQRFQAAVSLFQALGGGWTRVRAEPVVRAESVATSLGLVAATPATGEGVR